MDAEHTDDRPALPELVGSPGAVELRALAEGIQDVCLAHGWTVATAESCTGGLVADTLTNIPGSSGYVLGGIVAYADRIKAALLGVEPDLLEARGAVSAHVAKAMALGARERFGTTFALSVTGIAGPGGGSATKPVGLTFVAVASPVRVDIRRHTWTGDRIANKQASAAAVLTLLLGIAEKQAARLAASADQSARITAPAERATTSVVRR